MERLLVLASIFVESTDLYEVIQTLNQFPNVEELYEVTGEFDIVALVSASSIEEFSYFLKNKLLKIKGVKSTVTSVVLKAYKGTIP